MRKKLLIILIIFSTAIIIVGIFSGSNIKKQIIEEGRQNDNIYLDGTDVTIATETFVEIGSGVLGFTIIVYSFLLVAGIWGIYGIIILITFIIKKIKNKNSN